MSQLKKFILKMNPYRSRILVLFAFGFLLGVDKLENKQKFQRTIILFIYICHGHESTTISRRT